MEGNSIQPALSKYLVIDSVGFIRSPPLQEFGQNLITLHEVIEEIRDKEAKQRLKALPYDLQFIDPDTESIKVVSDFAEKTGDFPSLSATDIKVLALAYMLEVRHVGKDHLPLEPKVSFHLFSEEIKIIIKPNCNFSRCQRLSNGTNQV